MLVTEIELGFVFEIYIKNAAFPSFEIARVKGQNVELGP